jgi:hypothetical protein
MWWINKTGVDSIVVTSGLPSEISGQLDKRQKYKLEQMSHYKIGLGDLEQKINA